MHPKELPIPFPGHARPLASTGQPLTPHASNRTMQPFECGPVAVHAEVVVVTHQLARESPVLLLDRPVSMTSTPIDGGSDGPPKARTTSLERHPPRDPEPHLLPVQREAEKVEGRAAAFAPMSGRLKAEAAGLLRVEDQAERRKPFAEKVPHMRCILLVFEAQHEIIRVADEGTAPSKPRNDVAFEPRIEDAVQVDVSQQRRQARSLDGPFRRFEELLSVEDAHVQAFPTSLIRCSSAIRPRSISISIVRSMLSKKDTMSASTM